jgi:hypothetical protein
VGISVDELAEPLRASVRGLMAEANAGGTVRVSIVSGRRTNAEQVELRRKHCGPTQYDIYERPSRECNPETARPGTSKHETGQAVDFGGDLTLVEQLAPKYGLVRTVPSERWHYEGGAGGIFGQGSHSAGVGDLASGAASALTPDFIEEPARAVASFAGAVLNPRTWFRALGAVAGVGAIGLGLSLIARDLGMSPVGLIPGPAGKVAKAVTDDPGAVAADAAREAEWARQEERDADEERRADRETAKAVGASVGGA